MIARPGLNYLKFVGRSYDQVNCFQLVREFYLDAFGIELKHYFTEVPKHREDIKSLIYTNIGDFDKTEGPIEFGDILLFRVHGVESHIGVYVGEERFLHSSKTTGSVIDRMDRWKTTLVGAYRHKIRDVA